MKKYKKKILFYKLLKLLFLFLTILTLFFVIVRVFLNFQISNIMTSSNYEIKEPISFLLIGSDYRFDDPNITGARADTLIVVTLNPNNSRGHIELEFVSIPRDTVTYIPCGPYDGTYDKITHSFMYGLGENESEEDVNNAITCTQESVENLLNIDIDYYVLATFDSIVSLVDSIDGIDVISPGEYCVEDIDGNGFSETGECLEDSLYIGKGEQHLDGEHALGYARERYSTSDYDRNLRQQQVITAIAKKILSNPVKYTNDFIKVFSSKCRTNIEVNDIKTYINFATSLYNNVALNLSNDIPVYLDKKSSIYENETVDPTTSIIDDQNTNIETLSIHDVYSEDQVNPFENYTYITRYKITKEAMKTPTNIDNNLQIINEDSDTTSLEPIILEFSSYSMYATGFQNSMGWYSYTDQDTLYYTSNLLRSSLNYKVENVTYDFNALANAFYIPLLRNPTYAQLEGLDSLYTETDVDYSYNYSYEDTTSDTYYDDGSTDQTYYDDGTTDDTYYDDGTTDDTYYDDGTTDDTYYDDGTTDDGMIDDTTSDDSSSGEIVEF